MPESMPEFELRLIRCFASVFPALSDDDIRTLDGSESGSWDSLSTVTLGAVIQEEFGIEIDPVQLPEMNSFEAFRAYLAEVLN
ncbi:MAG: acyl carrier protein [Bryobacteraceae bacterium]